MLRKGNFRYEFSLPTVDMEVFIVHRGVSQGGKKFNPEQRRRLWGKKTKFPIAGVEIGKEKVTISAEGLKILRQKSLVIVFFSEKPVVWAPGRIRKEKKGGLQ
ncbi:MAG: hypothetical protein AAB451_02640 [Patescibacteria group bacterium]